MSPPARSYSTVYVVHVTTYMYHTPEMVELGYWILNTDYDHYAVTYGCTLESYDGTCQYAHAWLWSRSTTLRPEDLALARAAYQRACVDYNDFYQNSLDNGTNN